MLLVDFIESNFTSYNWSNYHFAVPQICCGVVTSLKINICSSSRDRIGSRAGLSYKLSSLIITIFEIQKMKTTGRETKHHRGQHVARAWRCAPWPEIVVICVRNSNEGSSKYLQLLPHFAVIRLGLYRRGVTFSWNGASFFLWNRQILLLRQKKKWTFR